VSGAASRSRALGLALVGAAFLYALWFHDKGIVMGEEGQILTEAESILAGKVLYRDIDGYVAPGVWYLTAGFMKLTGPSLNATRILMAALYALTLGVVWAISCRAASLPAAAVACLGLALLKVLAFPLGVFVFYTEFAVFFGLVALWSLLAYEQEGGRRRLVAAGAAVALGIVFKQNLGGYVALAAASWLLLYHRSRRELLAFAAPVAVVGSLVLLYFGAEGALPAMLRGLLYVPFAGFYGVVDVPYFAAFAPRALTPSESYQYLPLLFWEERFYRPWWGQGWAPVARGISIVLYAFPLVVSGAVVAKALLRRSIGRERLLLLLGALALFLGCFPRADFAHLNQNLVGFFPLTAAVVWHSPRRRLLAASLAPLLAGTAVFCAVILQNFPYTARFEHPRARLWISEPAHEALSDVLDWIERSIPPREPFVFYPTGGMYRFLTGRIAPQRYTVMLPPNIGHDAGEEAARNLERLRVRYVLYSVAPLQGVPSLEEFAPVLHEYLSSHYSPVASRGFRQRETLQVLKRNPDG